MNWLIAEDTARALQRAERSGMQPTQAQRDEFISAASRFDTAPQSLSVAGDVAEIRVLGVLTPSPDIFAMLFGGGNTAYSDIRAALAQAQSDPAVKSVVLFVDSPGGTVSGLFETLDAIAAFKKPIRARASNAQSAAYAIAAASGRIEAVGPASTFGSVGVATEAVFFADEEVVSLTSTDAPDKRPDLRTPEGQAVVVKHLDAIHQLFAEAIARGRRTSSERVNKEYGRGATLLAGESLKRGMIDGIAAPKHRGGNSTNQSAYAHQESRKMNAAELKLSYPAGCAELIAEGVAQERDRVIAHVTMGRKANVIDTALKAIEEGSQMTQALMSMYMSAGLDRRDVSLRQQESDQTGAIIDGAVSAEGAGDIGDQAAALMAAKRGKRLPSHAQ
jgi:ClpP class serine protease